VFARYVYDNEYTTVIRLLGEEGIEDSNPSKFKALQVDLRRKLALMDASLEALKDDPMLKDCYEAMEAA
jgi:hypothetical protein